MMKEQKNGSKPVTVTDDELSEAEVRRFYTQVGRDVVDLDRMFRIATAERPFVYEVKFDLWPASQKRGLAVMKGFGEDGGLISFQEGAGLVALLRGCHGRLRSGKMQFSEDQYPPHNYGKRVQAWLKNEEYRAAKQRRL